MLRNLGSRSEQVSLQKMAEDEGEEDELVQSKLLALAFQYSRRTRN